MSDTIDDMKAQSDRIKEERRIAKQQRLDAIKESGLPYTTHNNDEHIVIGEAIDYWPSTNLWITRHGKHRRHGLKNLISYAKTLKWQGHLK